MSGHNTKAVAYTGQIDAYGVYCPQSEGTYLVPITAISTCGALATLRVAKARNGQTRGVRHASDYVI